MVVVVVLLAPVDTVSVAQPWVLPCSRGSSELGDNISPPFPSLEPSLSRLYLQVTASCDPFPTPSHPAPAFPLCLLRPLLCPCPPTPSSSLSLSSHAFPVPVCTSLTCAHCVRARTHVCNPGALDRDEAGQEDQFSASTLPCHCCHPGLGSRGVSPSLSLSGVPSLSMSMSLSPSPSLPLSPFLSSFPSLSPSLPRSHSRSCPCPHLHPCPHHCPHPCPHPCLYPHHQCPCPRPQCPFHHQDSATSGCGGRFPPSLPNAPPEHPKEMTWGRLPSPAPHGCVSVPPGRAPLTCHIPTEEEEEEEEEGPGASPHLGTPQPRGAAGSIPVRSHARGMSGGGELCPSVGRSRMSPPGTAPGRAVVGGMQPCPDPLWASRPPSRPSTPSPLSPPSPPPPRGHHNITGRGCLPRLR